jgi:hypothetical protein
MKSTGSFHQRWRYWKAVHGGVVLIPAILAFLYPHGDPDARVMRDLAEGRIPDGEED